MYLWQQRCPLTAEQMTVLRGLLSPGELVLIEEKHRRSNMLSAVFAGYFVIIVSEYWNSCISLSISL